MTEKLVINVEDSSEITLSMREASVLVLAMVQFENDTADEADGQSKWVKSLTDEYQQTWLKVSMKLLSFVPESVQQLAKRMAVFRELELRMARKKEAEVEARVDG